VSGTPSTSAIEYETGVDLSPEEEAAVRAALEVYAALVASSEDEIAHDWAGASRPAAPDRRDGVAHEWAHAAWHEARHGRARHRAPGTDD